MKRTLLTLSLVLTAILAPAQTDSLSMTEKNHQLQEVVVESDVAKTSTQIFPFLVEYPYLDIYFKQSAKSIIK